MQNREKAISAASDSHFDRRHPAFLLRQGFTCPFSPIILPRQRSRLCCAQHKAATKKEIPRRGAKTAERQSDLYRPETLCALSVFARDKKPEQRNTIGSCGRTEHPVRAHNRSPLLVQRGLSRADAATPRRNTAAAPGFYRSTRAPAPATIFSTSDSDAIVVSPGVVIASAPWAAPYSTARCGSPSSIRP
jgi:hypothetical protein